MFSSLSAYNASCRIWKDEDFEYIMKLEDASELRNRDFNLFKQCVEVYSRAKTEYGDIVYNYRENYSNLDPHEVLKAFGFGYQYDEKNNYCASQLDVDLKILPTTNKYPKLFPVITVIGDGEFKCEHIYPEDFNKTVKIEDFAWLENNIRRFWKGGDGV
jgi:hypothetical protein